MEEEGGFQGGKGNSATSKYKRTKTDISIAQVIGKQGGGSPLQLSGMCYRGSGGITTSGRVSGGI
jgi:hypothetical protein